MQLFATLTIALGLASAALAAPPAKSTACVTRFTVTTSYPPLYQRYTTTVYKELAAIPRDLDCKGCSLKVVTKTINKSRKPDATVTRKSTLLTIPLCYDFPTALPEAK